MFACSCSADRKALKGDAGGQRRRWDGRIESVGQLAEALSARSRPAVIIDALFGAGLSRDFPHELADQVNGQACRSSPSMCHRGSTGWTGRPRGACIRADVTVTFFRKKPAHVLAAGKMLCGDVQVADIGIPAAVLEAIKPQLWENVRPLWPELGPTTHKYKRGHALVVSGPRFNTGAARLAAQAAQRAGAGLSPCAATSSPCWFMQPMSVRSCCGKCPMQSVSIGCCRIAALVRCASGRQQGLDRQPWPASVQGWVPRRKQCWMQMRSPHMRRTRRNCLISFSKGQMEPARSSRLTKANFGVFSDS